MNKQKRTFLLFDNLISCLFYVTSLNNNYSLKYYKTTSDNDEVFFEGADSGNTCLP